MVVNVESGGYYSLNRMGTELWERLSGGCSLASLLSFLSTHSGVSQERAQQDLSAFLENLASEGLIERTASV